LADNPQLNKATVCCWESETGQGPISKTTRLLVFYCKLVKLKDYQMAVMLPIKLTDEHDIAEYQIFLSPLRQTFEMYLINPNPPRFFDKF